MEKLRAILLLEADFKPLHKINFDGRLIPPLWSALSILQEIIGGRRLQAAAYLALSKKVITIISNTNKLPTSTICANATDCYDQVAHPYAILCSQCFGIELCYLLVIFRTMQNMKMQNMNFLCCNNLFLHKWCSTFPRYSSRKCSSSSAMAHHFYPFNQMPSSTNISYIHHLSFIKVLSIPRCYIACRRHEYLCV